MILWLYYILLYQNNFRTHSLKGENSKINELILSQVWRFKIYACFFHSDFSFLGQKSLNSELHKVASSLVWLSIHHLFA